MSNLYETIATLCSEHNITAYKMSQDLGLSKNLVTELKKGRKKGVSAETASKIANYFNVSVDYLLGKTDIKKLEQSDDELLQLLNDPKNRELFEKLMSLSEKEIDFIEAQIKVIESHRDM